MANTQVVMKVLTEVLLPLVHADGGELYVVNADERSVLLHLGGRFAGCPGNTLTTRRVIEPLIRQVVPSAVIRVTSGAVLPEHAQRLG